MHRRLRRSLVGIAVIACSFICAVPAFATIWLNGTSLPPQNQPCLTIDVGAASGSPTYTFHFEGLIAQLWTVSPDPAASGYYRIVSGISRPGNTLVLDIPSSNTNNGTRVNVYSQNGGANQSWRPALQAVTNGARCYSFHGRLDDHKVIAGGPEKSAVLIESEPSFPLELLTWCAYEIDNAGNLVPQNPSPFPF